MSDKNNESFEQEISNLIDRVNRDKTRVFEMHLKIDELKDSLRLAHEALDSIACRHVKIKSIENWKFQDAKKVIITDTKTARQALKDLEERHGFLRSQKMKDKERKEGAE